MAGYWVILALWAATAPPGLYIGWQMGGGGFSVNWGSPSAVLAFAVAMTWLLFLAWGYWLFKGWAAQRRGWCPQGRELAAGLGGYEEARGIVACADTEEGRRGIEAFLKGRPS